MDRTFDRCGEILAIARNLRGKVENIDGLADRAIKGQWSVEDFRAYCLERLPTVTPLNLPTDAPSFTSKDVAGYSITRAINAACTGRSVDGLEGELSREIALKTGKAPRGFYVPDSGLVGHQRNYVAATGTLGGYLVETQNLGDQFVELLRNKAQVMALGARVLNLTGPVTVPRQNAAGATNWVGESVAATLATGNFTQFTLTPQAVSGFQQYSKQLLMESNPSIDSIVRDDIMQQIALAIDLAALHGTGSGQPTGIANTTGINTVTLASNGQVLGNSTAYPAMVSLESAVASANADQGALAYLGRSSHAASLKTVQRFANTDSPVLETTTGPDGVQHRVNGYRWAASNQIATNLTTGSATTICSAIFFGNWNDLIIANFGATDLVVDPYVLAVNGVVRVIARRWTDIAVRHPASFAVLGGILAG